MPRGYIAQTKHNEIVEGIKKECQEALDLALITLEMGKTLVDQRGKHIADLKARGWTMFAIALVGWGLAFYFWFV